MKYYVYVLQSEKDNYFYVGYTKDIDNRIQQHNSGQVISTKSRRPLKIVYYEVCFNQQDATHREKVFKNIMGQKIYKKQVEELSNGVNSIIHKDYMGTSIQLSVYNHKLVL